MLELILNFILKIIVLGIICYLVHNIFSKNTKNFYFIVDQNGIKIGSTFYKK